MTLPELEQAVRDYLASSDDQAAVMVAGVLCVETARFGDDGQLISSIDYLALTDGMAASAGVVQVAGRKLLRDLGAYQLDQDDQEGRD